MTAKYYVTLTDYGATRVAQAHESTSILLSQLVIGDANNIPYDPIDKKSQTALVNQRATVPVQSVQINGAVTTVTATIAANIGGFNIHEIGLKDDAGKLVYIGNYHGGYKPVIAEGAGGELTIVIDITAESGKDALIEIDPNVVTANKKWVIDNFVRISTFEEALNNEKDARTFSDNLLNEKIDFEIAAKDAAVNALHERINHIAGLHYRYLNPASTRYPLHYQSNPINYDAVLISAYYQPGFVLKQTIRVHSGLGDANLHIYLPVAAATILHVATTYQSAGFGSKGDDDSYSRLVNIYEEGPPGAKQTVLVVRTDFVSSEDPPSIDRWIWIEVTCADFTAFIPDLLNYPYSRSN
ncbi:phage tail protein [Acinetobacter courvalinii]|uniref:phage tail protein n=1 Tax=Acinetobacter courvalinii TaxID=280147 RepID=UPI001D0EDC51|nr:phage tail protein [Acinetobacter courvalinii]